MVVVTHEMALRARGRRPDAVLRQRPDRRAGHARADLRRTRSTTAPSSFCRRFCNDPRRMPSLFGSSTILAVAPLRLHTARIQRSLSRRDVSSLHGPPCLRRCPDPAGRYRSDDAGSGTRSVQRGRRRSGDRTDAVRGWTGTLQPRAAPLTRARCRRNREATGCVTNCGSNPRLSWGVQNEERP